MPRRYARYVAEPSFSSLNFELTVVAYFAFTLSAFMFVAGIIGLLTSPKKSQ